MGIKLIYPNLSNNSKYQPSLPVAFLKAKDHMYILRRTKSNLGYKQHLATLNSFQFLTQHSTAQKYCWRRLVKVMKLGAPGWLSRFSI